MSAHAEGAGGGNRVVTQREGAHEARKDGKLALRGRQGGARNGMIWLAARTRGAEWNARGRMLPVVVRLDVLRPQGLAVIESGTIVTDRALVPFRLLSSD